MKRAIYEWGAIATSILAVVCFVYWAVTRSTPLADFELFLPVGHWNSMQILGADRTLTINDRRSSLEAIEEVLKYRVVNPPLTSKYRLALPGFSFQSINWSGQLTWSLRLSLWIPTMVMTLAAAFFIHGYLRVRRQALEQFLRSKAHELRRHEIA